MEEEADQQHFAFDGGSDPHASPFLVSLAPFSPSSTRRLSAAFLQPNRPVSSPSHLAWLSLQGRLVNAQEASSARTVGCNLPKDQALAWELFDPIHRFLIVAVIAVSVAQSEKNRQIWSLKKSVELRDQVLSNMQQKLDNLCEQLNNTKEHSTASISKSFTKNEESPLNDTFGSENFKFVDCGCWICDQHCDFFHGLMQNSSVTRVSVGNEVAQCKMSFANEEQEERRMSDLSDWASSVTSATDIQLNSLAIEQDIYNLKRDCEEKDSTIKELATLMNSSEVANSKRVAELEDMIRRKNATITKLKKDLVILEQKVIQLSRLRRSSFSGCESNVGKLTHMRDNLLYDMESSTSPSSSDSDSTPSNSGKDLAVSPLTEISANWKFETASSGKKQLSIRSKRDTHSLSTSTNFIKLLTVLAKRVDMNIIESLRVANVSRGYKRLCSTISKLHTLVQSDQLQRGVYHR
ncbi:inactive rhomboid protein [Senna tora]|uniref:Inactive rhomboid protein n=1 Tax=Senna tora TaxID=362788 RepID=A0A834TL47_9FABA|nr:inactive rhomboid protein [Senna tora]